MDLRPIIEKQQSEYNKLVTHIMQSWQWGEARKSLGTPVLRYGIYQNSKLKNVFGLTLHKIPFTNQFVGYLPKGPFPDKDLAAALEKIGKEANLAFIKVEPNVLFENWKLVLSEIEGLEIGNSFKNSPKSLFTKYNFIIDLTQSEEQLLKALHPKTRYNVKLAQKHGVKVMETTDNQAFEIYLKLYFETTHRQGYHGHSEDYHRKIWQTLKEANMARLLIASYHHQPLTAWLLVNFKDTLYYPYGGSSKAHPEVMANNLVAWEAIKLGKKLGLKTFDMWGALGPNADSKDSWYGFHKFKQGYGGKLVEYIGSYDLILNWPLYMVFTAVDKLMPLKVFLLKMLGK